MQYGKWLIAHTGCSRELRPKAPDERSAVSSSGLGACGAVRDVARNRGAAEAVESTLDPDPGPGESRRHPPRSLAAAHRAAEWVFVGYPAAGPIPWAFISSMILDDSSKPMTTIASGLKSAISATSVRYDVAAGS